MKSVEDLDRAIERYHQALAQFVKGNPEPQKEMFSRRDDITLANPFGGVQRGRQQVVEELEHASSFYTDGEVVGFKSFAKHVSLDLAFIVEVETYNARISGNPEMTSRAIRVTSVFRLEDGVWKVMHRQADPLVSSQAPESLSPRGKSGRA
jgi:ketosteroid isomerase-like protein